MVIIAILLYTLAIMLLWNAVLVPVLSVSVITYWQAMGIGALAKLLFGGKSHKGKYGRHCCCGHRGYWGKDWDRCREKMDNLSDEEKDKMKDFFGKFKDRESKPE